MLLIEELLKRFSSFMWGTPLLTLLLGGGLFFMIYSRFLPYRLFPHAISILLGKYDKPDDKGEINHYEALSSSIAATVGMGNIGGVAIAIATGGPGAIFWMWVCAFLGIATKFFTCTLSVMYRRTLPNGHVEGGPMYIITEGLGKKWKPLALLFAVAGLMGTWPIYQSNQLTQLIRDLVILPNGSFAQDELLYINLGIGLMIATMAATVILGGLERIAKVAGKLVPFMVLLYLCLGLMVLIENYNLVGSTFSLIFKDAFDAEAVLGGSLGAIIIIGAQRAAFSNEAGIGTAPMMHGDAKTNEPLQEGLVAMIGPFIDTIVICTITALIIIITGVWSESSANGVTLTAHAFNKAFPVMGSAALIICVLVFSLSTIFTFSYYGTKCFAFIFGDKYKHYYNYFYLVAIVLGSVFSLGAVINLIDGSYALMAIPTIISSVLLAPKVKAHMLDYYHRYKSGEIKKHT
ncbi:alanine/glycine:cation symporter family protein [Parashewanella tropica]|uniref:alanine/glycine:cation symporter family protein n=1 Tax=Parashewanella tropica TaxID=2547970 RepID=UPI001FE8C596|nr:alanine/glycine:cation symporter family protein [Parashewanella tropica]